MSNESIAGIIIWTYAAVVTLFVVLIVVPELWRVGQAQISAWLDAAAEDIS